MKGQRGIALLVVLWVLALLSLLLASLAGSVRLESRQALWQRQHTQGLLAAEAGVNLAVMGLLERNPALRWRADGQPHSLAFDGAQVRVNVLSELGKLDLNVAATSDFGRLLKAIGASGAQAEELERALDQRRGGQPPLRLLEEVRELPGMSESLYSAMLGEVTLWSGLASPMPAFASPLLKRALGLGNASGQGVGDSDDPGHILTLYSQTRLADGFTAALSVTLLLTASKEGTRPYRVLRWQE